MMLGSYSFLQEEHTVYVVTRRPGLPDGYSMQDMADDYALMIREELPAPVDVIGTSTGGSIAQHLAADHPDLVRRLVIHSSAHTLGDAAKEVQLRTGRLAGQGKWREASWELLGFALPQDGSRLPASEIKGRMTLQEVVDHCQVPLEFLIAELGLPEDVDVLPRRRDLAGQQGVEVQTVRDVVAGYQVEH